MTKIGAVINEKAGTLSQQQNEERLETIREHLKARVSPGCLAIVPASDVRREVQRLVDEGVDVLVIGGGDGTVSTAASLVGNTEVALAVLGIGTWNHFARDLGVPLDPVEAIRLLDEMKIGQVDLGEVNGHTFINNASLGIYPLLVREREDKEQNHGWRRWQAQAVATFNALRRLPRMRLKVEDDQYTVHRLTPFLFVGNNEYHGAITIGSTRSSIDGGRLWLCLAHVSGVRAMFRVIWQILVKGFDNADNLETRLVTEITVHSRSSKMTIAVDGETHRLNTPLKFMVRKKGLRVVVP